ncbi:Hypothetical protein NCS54_00827900 [Fusarium falciforme]|uniref:Hypothetical protein n=1 Tax=Fusarium falciforme TaxID=195108 RepID=UPI00230025E0|nr:Hypothetical protein NCS54_00827900 [Fusarium falciforme]WAO90838.1 Hypothetical protein NCS54_00827900 [Fusarium falciforme]
MHPQTDCCFFSLPSEIRIVIQREYLKQHPKIKATYQVLPPAERGEIQSYRGISIAPSLMLTCVKMYKEMRPMAFQDMMILFQPSKKPQLPLKVVLPPPRQYLQSLTLIAEVSQREMMEHQELALHLLGSPSMQKFTIEGHNGLQWLNGHDQCFLAGLRRPLERHLGQRVVRLPHRVRPMNRARGPPRTSFTFE